MSSGTPKLRQTCDSCRKAKIKCDRRTPFCGRCLVTGAPCDYGISKQGGRFKNGRPSRKSIHSSEAFFKPPPSDLKTNDASQMHVPVSTTTESEWLMNQDNSWTDEFIFPSIPFQQFGTPPTPSLTTASPTANIVNLAEPCGDYLNFQPSDSTFMTTPHAPIGGAPPNACSCLGTSTRLLQNLQRDNPLLQSTIFGDHPATADCAAILDYNEDIVSQCSTILNCRLCGGDDKADSIIVISTLLRRSLTFFQACVKAMTASHAPRPENTNLHTGLTFNEENKLGTDVQLVVLKTVGDLIPRLKEVGHALSRSHDRLACAALCASVSEELRRVQTICMHDLERSSR